MMGWGAMGSDCFLVKLAKALASGNLQIILAGRC